MLSVHGMGIIASEIITEYQSKNSTALSFWISSEIRNKETARYPFKLWVPNTALEEAREKIKPGKICEIVKSTIHSLPNKNIGDPTKMFIGISLESYWTDFRILKVCVYYEGIPGITEEKSDGI